MRSPEKEEEVKYDNLEASYKRRRGIVLGDASYLAAVEIGFELGLKVGEASIEATHNALKTEKYENISAKNASDLKR